MSTVRQAIKDLLRGQALSAREISQALSISEKEAEEHLQHLARAPGPGWRFLLEPAVCKKCGFAFKKRERLTPPTRCPLCRGQSIRRPRFTLVPEK